MAETSLKHVLIESRVRQADIARHLNRSRQSMCDLVNGRVRLTLADALQIAEMVGIDTGGMRSLL